MPGSSNERNWRSMAPGDLVLVYQNGRFPFWARVYAKAHSSTAASQIWSYDEGTTWEYMYFIDPGRAVRRSARGRR